MALLTVKQHSNFDGFPKAAELIEISGAHHLEAMDRANFNQLLQVAHDSDRLMEPGASWEVTFASLRRAASKHESNDRIRESLRRLRRTEVTVRYISAKDGRPRKLETSLLTFTDTAEDNNSAATIVFSIPDPLRLILVRSKRWGRIRCEVSYVMKCKYAIALYEMVALRINMDRCVETMSLAMFRDKLGVPPAAYERADNFMQFVIRPALLEVNKLSDLNVRIELERQHARAPAHAVTFSWQRKKGDEFREAMKELQKPKAGRRKRLAAQDRPFQPELQLE
jgi:hypothetical protein